MSVTLPTWVVALWSLVTISLISAALSPLPPETRSRIATTPDTDPRDPSYQTAIRCESCGHVRETTEEYPTLTSCGVCGSHNVRYDKEITDD